MRQLKITQSVTNRSTKAVDKYLTDISRIGLITQEREIELAKLIKQGDDDALQEMVQSNLRFVVSVAKQYQNRGIDLIDLINEGNIGLIKAAKRFDETRGFKFISFAVWWVRQSIIQCISDNGRLIKVPLNKIGLQNKFLSSFSKLEQSLGRNPTDQEIMEDMGLSQKEIRDLLLSMNKVQSYDLPISEDDSAGTLIDIIKEPNSDTNAPDRPLMFDASLKIDLKRAMSSLTERECKVLEKFYGIGDCEKPQTLEEISDEFEITPERVRQIKEKAVRRMRTLGRARLLEKYLN